MATQAQILHLKKELMLGLAQSTGTDRARWSHFIIDHQVPLLPLIDLLEEEEKIASRFSWILGGLSMLSPSILKPVVLPIFKNRAAIKIPNFHRTIAKLFHLVGVPEEIEGVAVDIMFGWLLDPKIIVSTKNHCLFALFQLTEKYPDLKIELKAVLEDQLDKHSNDFKKRVTKVLQQF